MQTMKLFVCKFNDLTKTESFEILTEHKKFVVAVKREFEYRKKSKMGKGSECLDFENPTQRTEIIVFQLSIPLQKIFQLRFS